MHTRPLFFYARRWRNNGNNRIRRKHRLKMLMKSPTFVTLDRLEKLLTPTRVGRSPGENMKRDFLQWLFKATCVANTADTHRVVTVRELRWALRRKVLIPFYGNFTVTSNRHLLAVRNEEITLT